MNNTSATPTTDEKFDIDRGDVLDSGKDEAGLILTGRGRANVQAVLSGATTIVNILHQGVIEEDFDNGFIIKPGTRLGLLQALAACHEVIFERMQGRSSMGDAKFVDCDSKAYQHMTELKKYAETEKEQRRAALIARMNVDVK